MANGKHSSLGSTLSVPTVGECMDVGRLAFLLLQRNFDGSPGSFGGFLSHLPPQCSGISVLHDKYSCLLHPASVCLFAARRLDCAVGGWWKSGNVWATTGSVSRRKRCKNKKSSIGNPSSFIYKRHEYGVLGKLSKDETICEV